jgi:hypothetical protein
MPPPPKGIVGVCGSPAPPQESAPQVGVKTIASCMPNGGLRSLRNVFGSSPALRSRRRRAWCPIPIRSLLRQPRGRHRHCKTRPARCNQWHPGGKWSSPRFQPRPEHCNHTTSLERLSKENRRWRRSDRRQTHSPRRDTVQNACPANKTTAIQCLFAKFMEVSNAAASRLLLKIRRHSYSSRHKSLLSVVNACALAMR